MITLDMTIEELSEAILDVLIEHLGIPDHEMLIVKIHCDISKRILDREIP